MKNAKPYKVIGAYDSETTNINVNGVNKAFPVLHQLGLLDGTELAEITPDNVEEHVQVELYRHSFELYDRLDDIVSRNASYVPVILCHNLAFDMYGLSLWLLRQNVRVLAKSARKPITFTILNDDNEPKLVIWDSLIFSQQPLSRMGKDCGYSKAVGKWDYEKSRTPNTPLTVDELEYAQKDIYTLLCWLGWWTRQNPDIEPSKLACNVVTKTGIVRERRKKRFSKLRGLGMRRNVDYFWLTRCKLDQPKTNDELFTLLACTRGGFTFVSNVNAGKPFNYENSTQRVVAYDATSMHPAQLVSHVYPYRFKEATSEVLELAFELIGKITPEKVLSKWEKPFSVAFYACFEFENLKPKKGSLFERYGIFPLASARYKTPEQVLQDEDNGDKRAYDMHLKDHLYSDMAENAHCAFGKIVSTEKAILYLTELSAWEVWQAYEWDSVHAVHGYETGKFCRPNDIDVISVMQFYKAKNEFKAARKTYFECKSIDNGETLVKLGIPSALVDEMQEGVATKNDVEACYMSLKADLNAIFGISCSNQYRRDTVLDENGISYVGEFGLCNAPKNPRVWYQFGQRIVGWSRIAQICAMYLIGDYVTEIINGDTDSVKVAVKLNDIGKVNERLSQIGYAIDKGKKRVCSRVKYAYPDYYDSLDGIGHYVEEFETRQFCASWNKAYCIHDEKGFSFTIAGIPTKRRQNDNSCFIGVDGLANRFHGLGMQFEDIASLFLGYNVTYSHDVILTNARTFPDWGEVFTGKVTDYLGNASNVYEPCALSLYPMSKTINDTANFENEINKGYALINNPRINVTPKIISPGGVIDFDIDIAGVFNG